MRKLYVLPILIGIMLVLSALCASAAQVLLSENFDKVPNGTLPAGWTPYDGAWAVKDGKLVGTSPDSSTLTRIVFGESTWTNYEISATLTFTWAKDNKRWASVMYRVQPNGGPPYGQIAIRQGTTASNGVEVAYRTTKPSWDVRTTAPYKKDFAMNETHRVRVVVLGNDVWAFIDDEPAVQLEGGIQELQGQVGLHVCGATVVFDDVVVRSIDQNDLAGLGVVLPAAAGKVSVLRAPVIVAHRGASAVAPENTAAAFQKAVDMGVDLIEMDVQRSRDGELIVMHDATVDRTTRGAFRGNIASLTLEQIKSLDAGSWKGAQFAGEKVLTLDEMLAAFRGKASFLIELKTTGIEEQVAAAIKKAGMANNVVVQSFSAESVRRFRAVMPEVPAGVLFNNSPIANPIARAESYISQVLATNASFAAIAFAAITPELVQHMKARGIAVYAWTVDDEPAIRRMVNAGVSGIITNYPDKVQALLAAEYQQQ